MLDHDGPGEAAAEMKPISAHVCPLPDPVHGSDGGHAWATPGGAAQPKGSIRGAAIARRLEGRLWR